MNLLFDAKEKPFEMSETKKEYPSFDTRPVNKVKGKKTKASKNRIKPFSVSNVISQVQIPLLCTAFTLY